MFRTSRITRLKTLTSYLWPKNNPKVKFRVVTSMSLLLAGKSLNVYVPYSFKQIIDTLSITHSSLDPSLLLVPVIAYGGARFGSTLFSELRNSVFAMVAHRAIRDASRNVLVHILNLDINFHLSRQTGSLVKSIDRGAKGINQILTALLFHIAPTAFEITLVCGILTYSYGWQYAAISLITVSSYSAFTFMTTTWRAVFRKEMNIADNQSSAIATDSLLNYEAVKHFSNESLEVSKFDKALENYEKAAIKSTTSLALLNIGQNLIFTSALTAVMYMGSNGILQGNLTIGDLVMINGLLFQLSMPLNFLGMVYRETTQAFIDMDEMFKLGSIESKIIDGDSSLVIKKGEIKFENVTFGYPGKQPILKNVSFTIPGGKSLAICGSSGCGKSTLLKLLFRFHDPQSGRILIDDQDIKTISLNSLRKSIGVVPQDTILFNQSIRENILYGDPKASMNSIHQAAKMANIHDLIISLPNQYESQVGERGMIISGGEKQRINLARVFLKSPSIILFDEPTSSLDTNTETQIMSSIYDFFDGKRTGVFIAHRLTTIMNCDLIIVLDKGTVVEIGSHDSLVAIDDGYYSRLWNSQQYMEDESDDDKTLE